MPRSWYFHNPIHMGTLGTPETNRPNRPKRRRHWISPNLGRLRRRRPARVHTELLETVRWKLSLGDRAGPWTWRIYGKHMCILHALYTCILQTIYIYTYIYISFYWNIYISCNYIVYAMYQSEPSCSICARSKGPAWARWSPKKNMETLTRPWRVFTLPFARGSVTKKNEDL